MRVRCPDNVKLAFASIPPYIYKDENSKVTGVFGNVISDAINFWCKDQTNLTYIEVGSGLVGLEKHIENATADIIFPIPSASNRKFFIGRPFIPVVETPGIAFYTTAIPNAKNAISDAVSNGWPALVFVIISALLAGMIYWISDLARQTRKLKEKTLTRRPFNLEGPFKGFYWAMVSMTTVGYGDFYPKSALGRLLATIWILMGIVIISLFTATVTTILLAACLANDVTLNGAHVAVMENSIEYNYAVKRNAFPKGYSTIDQLLHTAYTKNQAILLDSFIAGHYQEKITKFRLVEVMEYVFSNGLVLENKGLWLEPNIRSYIQNNKDTLFRIMSSSIRPLQSNIGGSDAEVKSNSLMSVENRSVFITLAGTTLLIGIFSLFGILFDRLYLRRRVKDNKEEKLLPGVIGSDDDGITKHQLKEQLEILRDIRGEMNQFLELVKIRIALGSRMTHSNCHMDDDLAINNIELVS